MSYDRNSQTYQAVYGKKYAQKEAKKVHEQESGLCSGFRDDAGRCSVGSLPAHTGHANAVDDSGGNAAAYAHSHAFGYGNDNSDVYSYDVGFSGCFTRCFTLCDSVCCGILTALSARPA